VRQLFQEAREVAPCIIFIGAPQRAARAGLPAPLRPQSRLRACGSWRGQCQYAALITVKSCRLVRVAAPLAACRQAHTVRTAVKACHV